MKQIPLSQKHFALVDDEDYRYLKRFKWHLKDGYACRSYEFNGQRHYVYMHHVVLGICDTYLLGLEVDHVNGWRADNQKTNLRVVTKFENQHNAGVRSDNKSGYKGVCWSKNAKKWVAQIGSGGNGKRNHIGYFNDPKDAARAYNERARELFGPFAKLNSIEEVEEALK